ncbi:MAG: hydrogenase formation protein HypD [Candidatus Nezhaarchaeota archaeon]|nr:hydrogenase formation protein HypD [Candidatus Nezhaarchaeota archaeon]
MLPRGLEVRSGPGCPVCVTSISDIQAAISLASTERVVLTTYGDMLRVPAVGGMSLMKAKAGGADVRVVYSIRDSIELAKRLNSQVVHFAIGFETTAPTTAVELLNGAPENFAVIASHRLIPPAIEHLLEGGEIAIGGFICPGHVSTIIGSEPYESLSKKYKKPMVISGFEPLDVLASILMLLEQLIEDRHDVEIEYTRSVRREGNKRAKEIINSVFAVCDGEWRGIGLIPQSKLRLREEFQNHDALRKFDVDVPVEDDRPSGCKCSEVLKGLIYPWDCPLYNKACTIANPIGPCAVSMEGACFISMKEGIKGLEDFSKTIL